MPEDGPAIDYATIRYEVSAGIVTLSFQRPERRNALSLSMRREIADAVSRAARDDAVRVLILTGSGGHFCAGGDIESLKERPSGADAGRQRMRDMWDWVQALIHFDKPVIAAVDGGAVGAGFSIALAADFVFATPGAYFCQSFAKIGLVPDLGGLYLLPRIVGLQKAKEIVFSARVIEAQEALELGIAYKIIAVHNLQVATRSLADTLSQGSAAAIGLAKSILNNSFQSDLRNVLELEASANGICLETDYHKDAIDRFLKKRPYAFTGFKP
jgi:2-(1,2-epoxy-1,2-dihydrophenyl)acetyl-CoA isomerase